MNKRSIVGTIFALAVFVLAPLSVSAEIFTRNLRQGDRGEDVRALQKMLNRDTKTAIAQSGPGSLGNETDYFGALTKAAVVRFQEQYSQDILVPNGLFSGTGFVGGSTRAKLNSLGTVGVATSPSVLSTTSTTTVPGIASTTFYLTMPSTYSALPGETITIAGVGFTKTGNSVSFGEVFVVGNISSPTTQSIIVTIPQNISPGRYALSAKNGNGAISAGLSFFVRKVGVPAPKISSISPTRATPGQTIRVQGSGFSAAGNTVSFGYASVSGTLSSDGTSLTATVPALPGPSKGPGADSKVVAAALPYTVELPGIVYVENEGGVSADVLITIVVSFGN